jgi:hypothetical protein
VVHESGVCMEHEDNDCMLHGGGVHGPGRWCMKVVCARCMTYESLVENYTVVVVSTVSN